MGLNIKELFKGAKETVSNYLAVIGDRESASDEFTLEERKQALKAGPVGSAAYNARLSTIYMMKHPSSVVVIGSAGKAGKLATNSKLAKNVVEAAKKTAGKAAPAIKNLPGYIKTVVSKEVAKVAPKSTILSPFAKKVAAAIGIGTAVNLTYMNLINTIDFYAWPSATQNVLKKWFPWLFVARQNADKNIKKPQVKKMTPEETAQLQQMVYEATGQWLTGEDLRKAIQDAYGITVIETKPTRGSAPGPLSVTTPQEFYSSIKSSTTRLKINTEPRLMINNSAELQEATMSEVAAFISALPGRMSFEYQIKATYVDADGRRRKGNFAIVKVFVVNKKGTKTELAELPLGTVPPTIGTPTPLNGDQVAQDIRSALSGGGMPMSGGASGYMPAMQSQVSYETPQPTGGLFGYQQIKNASLDAVRASRPLLLTMVNFYGFGSTDPDQLLGYWNSGFRTFDADKNSIVRNMDGMVSAADKQHIDAFFNWRESTSEIDRDAAAKRLAEAKASLKFTLDKIRSFGADPYTFPIINEIRTRLAGVSESIE